MGGNKARLGRLENGHVAGNGAGGTSRIKSSFKYPGPIYTKRVLEVCSVCLWYSVFYLLRGRLIVQDILCSRSFTLKFQSIESFTLTRSASSDASAIILASMRGCPDAPSRSSFSRATAPSRWDSIRANMAEMLFQAF